MFTLLPKRTKSETKLELFLWEKKVVGVGLAVWKLFCAQLIQRKRSKILMINFWSLLLQKTDSVWLPVALILCVHIHWTSSQHIRFFQAARYVDNIEARFHQFVVEYNRTYDRNSSEYAKRLAIFAVSSTGSVSMQKQRENNCNVSL